MSTTASKAIAILSTSLGIGIGAWWSSQQKLRDAKAQVQDLAPTPPILLQPTQLQGTWYALAAVRPTHFTSMLWNPAIHFMPQSPGLMQAHLSAKYLQPTGPTVAITVPAEARGSGWWQLWWVPDWAAELQAWWTGPAAAPAAVVAVDTENGSSPTWCVVQSDPLRRRAWVLARVQHSNAIPAAATAWLRTHGFVQRDQEVELLRQVSPEPAAASIDAAYHGRLAVQAKARTATQQLCELRGIQEQEFQRGEAPAVAAGVAPPRAA